MRLGVWGAAGVAFVAMLMLDTQAVLQLGWMTALGRLGAWPQRVLLGGVLVFVAAGLVASRLRRRRARPVRRTARPRVAGRGKVVRKATKGGRAAAQGVAPGRPSRV